MDRTFTKAQQRQAGAETAERDLTARFALVVYHGKKKAAGVHMESWGIEGNRLRDPRPVTDQQLTKLAEVIGKKKPKEQRLQGMIDGEVLYLEQNKMAFWVPAGVHTVHYGGGTPRAGRNGKLVTKEIWMPPIVFVYWHGNREHNVSVLWSKTDDIQEVREGKPVLTGSMMPNTGHDGYLCLGSSMARRKFNPDIPTMKQFVITSYFGSSFNEFHSDEGVELVRWMHNVAPVIGNQAHPMNVLINGLTPRTAKFAKEAKWKNLQHFIAQRTLY